MNSQFSFALGLKSLAGFACLLVVAFVAGCGGGGGGSNIVPPANYALSVQAGGSGAGTIVSSPAGINCGSSCSASYASGTSVTLTASPASGSTFSGWSGACSGTASCTVSLSSSSSVTATFDTAVVPTYQLAVTSAGTGTGTVTSQPSGINCGSTCSSNFNSGTSVTLTAAPASGSTFVGWSGACSGSGTCTVSMTAATAVTATFNTTVVPQFPLSVTDNGTGTGTVSSSPAGITCGATCTASFPSGSQVTLTATADPSSTFAGWSGAGCSGTGTCSVTVSAAASVTATFNTNVVPQVTLTVQAAGQGSGTIISAPAGITCPGNCTANFPAGTQVTLSEAVGANSSFAGWSGGGCSGTATSCALTLNNNATVTATFNAVAPQVQLTVQSAGNGTGTVSSTPSGITCGTVCSASFPSGTQVTLAAAANTGSTFTGWSGACTGQAACVLTLTTGTSPNVTANFSASSGNIGVINHIVFLSQENRSLDNYFGAMRQYWAQHGIPDQSFDGLPQFNPTSGIAPLYGPPPSVPGCDPTSPPPGNCVWDPSNQVQSFHLTTACTENTSPSWNEAHVDWDYTDQVGKYKAKNNGFVITAAHDARTNYPAPFYDTDGIRTMGYYNGNDLNYDYFMATAFATSDRFFQPALTRTNPNREYLIAATSGGYAYPNGAYPADTPLLKSQTIYQALDKAGISWKIYVYTDENTCPTLAPSCMMSQTYLKNFTYSNYVLQNEPQNIAPLSQYYTDVQNGTLPQVAQIEPVSGLDEHGSDSDTGFPTNVQYGIQQFVSKLINGLMQSQSWSDSAFILTYDESGGLYDHVPPQPAVSPDGIPPIDLPQDSVCHQYVGQKNLPPLCDFKWTGYRIPLIVISPYAKQNYVSHTVMDATAILKFIETRYNIPALNNRDAAQPDMTEFFDFNNASWPTPPTPPSQKTSNPCYLDHLP